MKGTCEICKEVNYLEKHHIQSKCFEGSDNNFNICYICSNCHEKVHRGDIIIEGKFLTLKGYKVIYRNYNELAITDRISKVFVK